MKTKKTMLFLSTAFILLVISACGPAAETEVPTQEGAQQTSIYETAQAAVAGTLTQMALSNPSDTPVPFFTETPFQTGTALPLPTSNKAMISVSKETNCRLGPDIVYELVGQLVPGIMAEVFALDPTRGYYYIENPGKRGTYCWIWGFYATQVNDFTGMPIYTPAHTPIPANTSTPGKTTSPTVTGTITSTLTATPTGSPACTLVSLAPAQNAVFKPKQEYIDLDWIVTNASSSTWKTTDGVSYKFVSGDSLHKGVITAPLTGDIAPGAISQLLLDLTVPDKIGKYTETWALVKGTVTLCTATITFEVK